MNVSVARLVAAVGLPLMALALCMPFSSADATWDARKFAGVWLACLLAPASLWGWGCWFIRGKDPALAPAFGTLLAAFALFFLGMLGGFGVSPLYFVALVAGLYLFRFPAKAWLFTPLLLFALVPNSHSDPLYYHLLAARRWYDSGRIYFDMDQPLFFLGGLWDLLFLWPISFWKLGAGQELIYQQLAGQVISLTLGAGGSFWLVSSCFQRLGMRARWAPWAAIATLASPLLLPVAFTAKNDWGLILWLAAGVRLLLETDSRNRTFAGVFFGAAIASKWASVPAAGFLAILLLLRDRRHWLYFLVGALVGLAPVVLRNIWFTGAPFFPLFTSRYMSSTNIMLFHEYRAFPRLPYLGFNLARLIPSIPALLLAPFGFIRARKGVVWQSMALVALTVVLGLILSPSLSWRLSSPLPFLVSAAAVWGFVQFWGDRFVPLAIVALLLLALSIWPMLPLLRGLARQPAGVIREFDAGDAMAFVRMRPGPPEPTALGGNPQLFYLSGFPAITPEASVAFDGLLATPTASGWVKALRARGFRWYIETRSSQPMGRGSFLIWHLVRVYPEAVVFEGARGRVTDLKKLASWINSPDFREPHLPAEGAYFYDQD